MRENFNFKKVYEELKIDFRKDKGLVDIESACIILEQYLAHKN